VGRLLSSISSLTDGGVASTEPTVGCEIAARSHFSFSFSFRNVQLDHSYDGLNRSIGFSATGLWVKSVKSVTFLLYSFSTESFSFPSVTIHKACTRARVAIRKGFHYFTDFAALIGRHPQITEPPLSGLEIEVAAAASHSRTQGLEGRPRKSRLFFTGPYIPPPTVGSPGI
jgi:hypothetical protein